MGWCSYGGASNFYRSLGNLNEWEIQIGSLEVGNHATPSVDELQIVNLAAPAVQKFDECRAEVRKLVEIGKKLVPSGRANTHWRFDR